MSALLLAPAAWLGHVWQRELAASVDEPDPPPTNAIGALLIAGAVVMLAVLSARGLRFLIRLVARALSRLLPRYLAFALAILAVVGLTTPSASR
jgi:uncharacterized membrane protein